MEEYSVLSDPLRVAHNKSRGFEFFIRSIGDSKSKHEEDKVVKKELVYLKEQAESANITSKQTRELLICLIYCEMLGHNASFGYIHAIKFAQQSSLLEKRTGYLAVSIFLQKHHHLVILLINTLQKDLKSTNVVAKSTALNVICKLVDADMIPALLPLIVAAVKDKRVEIRKKALMTLRWVHTIKPSLIQNIGTHLANAISDPDPSVMAASLHLFYYLIKANPNSYRKYLNSFLQILTQILELKLSEFNYHGVQAPWIQIKLLKILALLGKQHKSASETMSPVLLQIIIAMPTDCNIGCAVMFECIQTITTIYPVKSLLDIAFKKTALFLTSSSSDLKCLGITAMTALVELDLSYAGDPKQQQIVLNCLDDDDRTMRKKTLELLYKITNTENVVLVSAKLLEYIRSTMEHYIKDDVVVKLIELAGKYAPDPIWYVETLNDVISSAPGFVNVEVPHRLMKLIASAEKDEKFKTAAVSRYIELIKKKTLPDTLLQISCWVIGEYAYLVQDKYCLSDVLGQLTVQLDRKFTDPTTRGWIVTSIAKLTARIGTYLPEARGIIDRYRTGCPAELRQRCHEINMLAADIPSMVCMFPIDSSQDDIKVCPSLSFLDEFVCEALSAGARPFQQHMKHFEQPVEEIEKAEIQITPYEHPFKNIKKSSKEPKTKSVLPEKLSSVKSNTNNKTSPRDDKVELAVTKQAPEKPSQPTPPMWGRTGYSGSKISRQSEQPQALQSNLAESSSKSSSSSSHEGTSKPVDMQRTLDNISQSPIDDEHDSHDESVCSSPFFSGVAKRLSTIETRVEPRVDPRVEPRVDTRQSSLTADPIVPLMVINDEDIQTPNEEIELKTKEALSEQDSLGDDQVEHFLEAENNKSMTTKQGLLVELEEETPLMSHVDIHHNESATELDVSCEDIDNSSAVKSLMTTDDSFQQSDHSIEICSDSNVRLDYSALHNPTELILSFKLTNHCQARIAVEQVALTIDPPSNLVSDMSSTNMTMDTLVFLDNVTHNVSLKYQYPATHMCFKGTLNYIISRTSKVMHFCQEITLKDLLRPLNLTTDVFGEKWTTTSNDVRQIAGTSRKTSCEEMMEDIARHMNISVVDIIGYEGIAAATVLDKDICLVHCKFLKDTEVWVKTTSKLLSEITMRECVSFLQKPQ